MEVFRSVKKLKWCLKSIRFHRLLGVTFNLICKSWVQNELTMLTKADAYPNWSLLQPKNQVFQFIFHSHSYSHTYVLPIENYQCLGRFAADLEICCRELFSTPPCLTIPVYNRNLPSSVSQQMGTYSGASVAPSLIGGEEQLSTSVKLPFTGRIPSNSGTLAGMETDNRSHSILGKSKSSSRSNKTQRIFRSKDVNQSDLHRPLIVHFTSCQTVTFIVRNS